MEGFFHISSILWNTVCFRKRFMSYLADCFYKLQILIYWYSKNHAGKNTIDVASQITALNRTDWSSSPLWVTVTYPQSFANQIVRTAVALNDYWATNI